MIYTDDPIRDASIHYDELEKEISKRAICDICEQNIQDEFCYETWNGYVHKSCWDDNHLVETPVED